MYMVKGAKTISQYKILKWVEENFVKASVKVKFTDKNTAILTDCNHDELVVSYDPDKGIVVDK